MEKLRNSWELLKASFEVLLADKELVIFPILSGIAMLLVTLTFALPMVFAGFLDSLIIGDAQIVGYIVGFAFYIVQYFVIIFANSALVGAALIRLRGGDPTVGDGLRIASQHIGNILVYALISATIGMLLRTIAERGRGIGQLISFFGGMAWNLATYLVVPILVVEGVGPVEAIKRSSTYLKRTWGEQIAGNFSVGLIFGLAFLALFLVAIPVVYFVVVLESIPLLVVAAFAFIMAILILGLLSSTLTGIYVAAVYRFAAEGETGGFFEEGMVRGAFQPK